MELEEYTQLLEVHPTACNTKEKERLTRVESPEEVHARVLRIAAEAAAEGDYRMVMEICAQVMEEVEAIMEHWE